MNRDVFKGEWNQLKGRIKQQWGRLTDDDITRIDGDRDVLVGRLQERYGRTREQAQAELEQWLNADQPDYRNR